MTARRRERGVGVRLSKRKGYVIDNYLFTLYLDLGITCYFVVGIPDSSSKKDSV